MVDWFTDNLISPAAQYYSQPKLSLTSGLTSLPNLTFDLTQPPTSTQLQADPQPDTISMLSLPFHLPLSLCLTENIGHHVNELQPSMSWLTGPTFHAYAVCSRCH